MEGAFRMSDEVMQLARRFRSKFGCASRRFVVSIGVVFVVALFTRTVPGQSYLTSTGQPSFGAPVPVELGFVDASTGNLHLSIP